MWRARNSPFSDTVAALPIALMAGRISLAIVPVLITLLRSRVVATCRSRLAVIIITIISAVRLPGTAPLCRRIIVEFRVIAVRAAVAVIVRLTAVVVARVLF